MWHQRLHRAAHGFVAVMVITGSLALLGCADGDDTSSTAGPGVIRLDPAVTGAAVSNTNARVLDGVEGITFDAQVFPFEGGGATQIPSPGSEFTLTNFRAVTTAPLTDIQADFTLDRLVDGKKFTGTARFSTPNATTGAANAHTFTPTSVTLRNGTTLSAASAGLVAITPNNFRMRVGTLVSGGATRDVPIGNPTGILGTLQLTIQHTSNGITTLSDTPVPPNVRVAVFDANNDGRLDVVVNGINTGINVAR